MGGEGGGRGSKMAAGGRGACFPALLVAWVVCLAQVSAVDVHTPTELSVENGTEAKLPCTFASSEVVSSAASVTWSFQAEGSTTPVAFFYYSNGRAYPGRRFEDRSSWAGDLNKKDASIKIANMQFQDKGTYTCDVKNPPDIVGTPGEINVRVVERGPQGSSETAFLPHPVIFPARFHSPVNNSMLDHLSKLPRKNSCTSNGSSCLSTPSEICIYTPQNHITAAINQVAIIPVEIDATKPNWDFIEVHWHHTKGTNNDFILKYGLRTCSKIKPGQKWWESHCHQFLEVLPAHRWKVSLMMNAWLIIWNVQQNDAGRYQVTVKSNNMKDACSFMELSVTTEHEGSRNPVYYT
ncbi:uncharacterized protein [Anolis sagrei]|uniref:uncharacterized protein n=1 Tax=Anolis sagrei TaxID=38937 RepID=UPI003521FAA9